jgi:Ulp1 family protease
MSEEEVNKAFKRVLLEKAVRVGQISLTYEDMTRLRRQGLLNDEIINAYLETLVEQLSSPTNKCYLFNTHFYSTYVRKGYGGTKGWTRHDNILSYDKVFIPVHMNEEMHWCLMVMDMKLQKIMFMDSDSGDTTGKAYMEKMLGYLSEEYRRLVGGEIELYRWKGIDVEVTQQENDWDCGVLMCQFARAMMEGSPIDQIKSSNVEQYRRDMVVTLIK